MRYYKLNHPQLRPSVSLTAPWQPYMVETKGCDEYVIRPGLSGGHGGGDSSIVKDFIECITKGGIQPKAGIKATHDAALIAAAAQDAIEQKSVINLQV
jgi:hypothetical protein